MLNKTDGLGEQVRNYHQHDRRRSMAIRAAHVCVFEVDINRQLYTYFENSEAIFGVHGEQILREVQPFSELPPEEYRKAVSEYFSHPEDEAVIAAAFESVYKGNPASYEARMKAGKSEYVWCKIDVVLEPGEDGPKMIGVISNINDFKTQIDVLTNEVQRDSFTKLYTKRSFEKIAESLLRGNTDKRMAFIMIDLDNFKDVNDTYGHSAGDEVLLALARNLESIFRKTDIIARFGGDEFIILMKDIPTKECIVQKLEKLLKTEDSPLGVTKSIGVSFYPETADNLHALMEKADEALYMAKRTKNTYVML